MAATAESTRTLSPRAKARARRPSRERAQAAELSPSYRPMWQLAEQAVTQVDKGLRLLPGRPSR